MNNKVTRGQTYRLFKKMKEKLGQTFFSVRVIDLWNELNDTDSTVSADSVTAFNPFTANVPETQSTV